MFNAQINLNCHTDLEEVNMRKPNISVIGIGYVGLCTAVGFASRGYNVTASTHDAEKAGKINKGTPPFHEPNVQEMLKQAIQSERLICLINQTEKAVLETDLTFDAVGTPSRPDGSIDLQFIETSSRDVGKALNKKSTYHVMVIKSTVVPGTTQDLVKPILEKESKKKCGLDFGLCMNPEFLRQGSAFEDTLHPDRIVIGEHDKKSGDTLENLYKDFYGQNTPPTIRTTLSTAELIKYASNSMLATKISFINMIANVCEKIPGVDVKTVGTAMGLDKRIGPLFLNAGLGYGGSCFPKDVKALIAYSKNLGCNPQLLEAVESVNEAQPPRAVQFCKEQLGTLKGKNIAILGLAFKPDTDDMREARVIPIINNLIKGGANVMAYDPVAMPVAKTIFKTKIGYATSATECLRNADCCIVVTEWDEFKKLKPEDFTRNMRQPILIDGRRIYDAGEFSRKLKFAAIGLGRKPKHVN
jgi:UDPglucose 6-dehydrogenase